jgi:hypothetical protein
MGKKLFLFRCQGWAFQGLEIFVIKIMYHHWYTTAQNKKKIINTNHAVPTKKPNVRNFNRKNLSNKMENYWNFHTTEHE